MQTFLPFPDFAASAAVLQLLRGSWPHHPAARMWRGHRVSLSQYGLVICAEWCRRGYADTCAGKIAASVADAHDTGPPPWLGDPALHASHRSALARKAPAIYAHLWPDTPPDLPYVWPPPT